MKEILPFVYVSGLLVLLTALSVIVFRQIFKTRKTESRLSQLQNKLKQEKGTAQEYYELGSIYLDKKLYVQASKLFQKALKEKDIEPENRALTLNALGFAYFAQEQYDLAIRQYKEALKLYPEYVTAWNNLGHVYERKQLTSQALDAYEQALQYDPAHNTAKRRAESLRKRLATPASAKS